MKRIPPHGDERPAPDRRRLDSIDALRGVGIAAVVALHTSWALLDHATLASAAGRTLATLHLGAAFGVPLFLGLSAFGLARRHDFRVEGAAAFVAFLSSRARQLLPAYVVWSLLSGASRDLALLATPGRVFSLLVDGSGGAQFYFVPTLFELYVWWPLVGLLVPRRSPAMGIVLVAAGALASLTVWQWQMRFTYTSLGFFSLYIAAAMFAATLSPPSLRGTLLATFAASATVAALALAADVASFVAVTHASNEAMSLASTIFRPLPAVYTCAVIAMLALAASSATPGRLIRSAAGLGRSAYGIFLCHLLVAQFLVHPLLAGTLPSDSTAASAAFRFTVEWGMTLAAAAAVTLALARSPRTRWLVGAA